MGVTTLLSVCILIGTVSADNPWDTDNMARNFSDIGMTIFIIFFVIAASCMLVLFCIGMCYAIRMLKNTTYTHSAVTVISDAQNPPQGQTGFCIPSQPQHSPMTLYDLTPPPEYQPSTPNPVVNPVVVPPGTVVPIAFVPQVMKTC